MTLDQIKVLDMIVKTGSYRAAAEQLHRAQSALSYAIKTLEEDLGIEVLDRSAYRPTLTAAGRILYEKGKVVLLHAEQMQVLGRELATGVEPELRLAITSLCPLEPVMAILKKFAAQQPVTQLKLSIEHMGKPEEMLLSGEADLALTNLFSEHDDFEKQAWSEVEIVPVVAAAHPLARRHQEIGAEELQQYTQVIVSNAPNLKKDYSAGVVEGANHWRVTDFPTKKALIMGGLGWGGMPLHLVAAELREKQLVQVSCRPPERREIFLVRSRRQAVGPAKAALWSIFGSSS